MSTPLTTREIDTTNVLSAYRLYKANMFREATSLLLEILDFEPQNWQARLFLAACYLKTGQPGAAQRSFRMVYDNCPDADLKQRACLALQLASAKLQQNAGVPIELANVRDKMPAPVIKIEHIIQ